MTFTYFQEDIYYHLIQTIVVSTYDQILNFHIYICLGMFPFKVQLFQGCKSGTFTESVKRAHVKDKNNVIWAIRS
jgi:hypothetical protein